MQEIFDTYVEKIYKQDIDKLSKLIERNLENWITYEL